VDFNRPKLFRLPSLAFLSFVAGLDEQEVKAVLERLGKRGYIEVSGDSEQLNVKLAGLLKIIEVETGEKNGAN
jgi:hypothetical protein